MVVRIRLARWGARNNPFFGIVVANSRSARDKKHLERIGTYNPIPDKDKVKHIELNTERIKYWLGVGAQPSDRVAWILAKANIMPLTPKQLQRQGELSLTDPKTWKISIKESDGTEKVLDPLEARAALTGTPAESKLPKDYPRKPTSPERILKRDDVKLDGTPPNEKLTPREILTALQEFSGIR
ncbi:hypothetical protein HDU76_001300 [Blyttiomyces sp. JEL0837]|nr:hypothetical protein HDU76_001300 [Blyttiomyces sp. JEL0837]